MDTMFGIEYREQICKARNLFASLGTYERDQIAVLGTAFTSYEDEGPVFCAELSRIAREWRTATMADDGCRCPHNGHHDGPDCFCRHLEGCPEDVRG